MSFLEQARRDLPVGKVSVRSGIRVIEIGHTQTHTCLHNRMCIIIIVCVQLNITCADGKMGVRFHLLAGMSIFQKKIDSHDKNVGKVRSFVGSDFCLHSGRKFSK